VTALAALPPDPPRSMGPAFVAHCRAGFEPEAAADLQRLAEAAGTALDLDAPAGRGFVVGRPARFDRARWSKTLAAAAPVFIRALFIGSGPHVLFDAARTKGRPDRVVPLLALIDALRGNPPLRVPASMAYSELRLETADTNDGKELSGLCRALAAPLAQALIERGALLDDGDAPEPVPRSRLHVLFADGAHVFVGISVPPWGSPWPMGIPRLRMPREAPSRSTQKLAEAFITFLGERAPEMLRAGMKAVDLGAAPGGWSWQLAHRGLRVTAIDNGPLKGEVAQDSLVTHLRVDGLGFRPQRPVDWMVCDIAEQPARIAALVGRWIADGHARRTIFNLKLPMKKRYEETVRCRQIIEDVLRQAHVSYRISLRQLYHDREEVTGFIERIA
jgi:23S rRNA (cytidine2498-2'-O)-methyltransferase